MENNTIEPPILKRAKYIVKAATPETLVMDESDFIHLDIYANSSQEACIEAMNIFAEAELTVVVIVNIIEINQIKLKWSV